MPTATNRTTTYPPQATPARCPRCGAAFVTDLHTVIDAADADAFGVLITGRLNTARCPTCGATVRIPVPVLYHDAAGRAALVHLPPALQLSHAEGERAIGNLTNRVIDHLPPDKRGMYLLQPQVFLSEESFMAAVLRSAGVTPSAIDRIRADADLVEELLTAVDDAALLASMEAAHRNVDYDLLLLVTSLADASTTDGDTARSEALLALRHRLLNLPQPTISLDEFLRLLLDAHQRGELDGVVAHYRPVLDYGFFTALTERIGQASDAEWAAALTALRSALLDALDRFDKAVQAELRGGAETLRRLLESTDPASAIRDHHLDLSPGFFLVLEANRQAAEQEAMPDVVAKLDAIRDSAMAVVDDDQGRSGRNDL
jgi:hypothetical protein